MMNKKEREKMSNQNNQGGNGKVKVQDSPKGPYSSTSDKPAPKPVKK